ncbi:MAG: GNAT family N-acetyltransferase [Novosphingobium sp.]|nr:GNAT family N-acetyltransferase [Novosphingobium sp.]
MTHIAIRDLAREDLPPVAGILDATGLFPSELLPDMAEPWLSGEAPHHWLVAAEGAAVIGFAYAEPERMTEGTVNLLAIAVDPARQNGGVGKALVSELTARLAAAGNRVLLVETSSLEGYTATQAFHAALGFTREARIRDFYQDGDDKIVFWKRISS